MRFIVMFVTAVCVLFRIKLRWPRKMNFYDIVLCSWARHFTLTVSLSPQVYKWVRANLMLGVNLRWASISSRGRGRGGGGVEILSVGSCYRNRDKLWPDAPLGSRNEMKYNCWLFEGF